ncbi:MAG: DUF362 domain-containing protein [Candidatus Eisenbacteria bacterium]|nr:DUF362 domain-containing protein [Candidatus Eisenbacteria bacterium]
MGKSTGRDRLTRRDFFRKSLSTAAGLGACLVPGLGRRGACSPEAASGLAGSSAGPSGTGSAAGDRETSRALVLVARRAGGASDAAAFYTALLDASVRRLTGAARTDDAWASLFSPEDVVAIKVNAITGKTLSTSAVLVEAVTTGLMSCGIPGKNIVVWDRTTRELADAGFAVNFSGDGPRCFGTDAPSAGYEASPTELGSVGSCYSRIVTEIATAIINVPILKEHSLAGITACLKNNYGAIHNPNKYHDNGCSPFVADVNSHPAIRRKTRLNVCDARKVQVHGGPGYKPKWTTDVNGILVSRDPVALDTVGVEMIDKLRKSAGLRTLREEGRSPRYLAVASKLGLGVSDRSRIDVLSLEVP